MWPSKPTVIPLDHLLRDRVHCIADWHYTLERKFSRIFVYFCFTPIVELNSAGCFSCMCEWTANAIIPCGTLDGLLITSTKIASFLTSKHFHLNWRWLQCLHICITAVCFVLHISCASTALPFVAYHFYYSIAQRWLVFREQLSIWNKTFIINKCFLRNEIISQVSIGGNCTITFLDTMIPSAQWENVWVERNDLVSACVPRATVYT